MTERTQHYAVTLAEMQEELEQLGGRVAALKKAIGPMEQLVGSASGPGRRTGPASTADCPESLRAVAVTDRILGAMWGDPERCWTLSELHAATFTSRRSDVRNNLDRLERRGKVVHLDNDSWGPASSPR